MTDSLDHIDEDSHESLRPYYAPLGLWKLALLLLVTLNLYTVFWLYRAAQDIRNSESGNTQPWLWLFAPLNAIALAISTARMSEMLTEWAETTKATKNPENNAIIIGLCAFAGGALTTASLKVDLPTSVIILSMLLLAAPILILQRQLNVNKTTARLNFRSPAMKYTWPQRILALLASIFLVLWGIYLAERVVARIGTKPFEVGMVEEDPKNRFALTATVEGWRKIKPGLNTEEAEFEFLLDGDDDYAAIFYETNSSLHNTADARRNWARDLSDAYKCTHTQGLLEDKMQIETVMRCVGYEYLLGGFIVLSRTISDGDRQVEIVIYMDDESPRLLRARENALNLADGLSLN